jgi:transcription termination factor Rho
VTETETLPLASGDAAEPGKGTATRRRSGGGLSGMVLAELQQVAGGLGIKGTGRMRKGQLIEAIQSAQSGNGGAPAPAPADAAPADTAPARRATRRRSAPAPDAATAPADDVPVKSTPAPEVEPAVNSPQALGMDGATDTPTGARGGEAPASDDTSPGAQLSTEPPANRNTRQRSAARDSNRSDGGGNDNDNRGDSNRSDTNRSDTNRGDTNRGDTSRNDGGNRGDGSRNDGGNRGDTSGRGDSNRSDGGNRGETSRSDNRGDSSRTDNRGDGGNRNDTNRSDNNRSDTNRSDTNRSDTNRSDTNRSDTSRSDNRSDRDDEQGGRRRRRNRNRDRDRGPDRSRNDRSSSNRHEVDTTVNEDDVLLPVAGILDILDNYAFVRTSGYLPGDGDVYVSLSMVRKAGLRKGDAVIGQVRQQREADRGDTSRKDKFNPLVRIDSVNGMDIEESRQRLEFSKLTPLYAQERLRLEHDAATLTTRIIDIVAPIGKGQRGLIVSPPKAGKTMVLQAIANAITTNNPECHLMVVLVDERPEEVTDMQRTVKGEVIASTFDRPATDHTTVAELAIERAKRLVEMGHDVVVLLDSITRLGRAYNIAAPASGRILSGGVDSSALYPPKRFFGAARNIEFGGSLTILATALIETGSRMDEVIFEEFKGTGNMELRLRREFADKRIFPAIDVDSSGTRREELLLSREELAVVWKLRRVLSALDGQQALELMIEKLKKTASNVEFLMQVQKTTPMAVSGRNDD